MSLVEHQLDEIQKLRKLEFLFFVSIHQGLKFKTIRLAVTISFITLTCVPLLNPLFVPLCELVWLWVLTLGVSPSKLELPIKVIIFLAKRC